MCGFLGAFSNTDINISSEQEKNSILQINKQATLSINPFLIVSFIIIGFKNVVPTLLKVFGYPLFL